MMTSPPGSQQLLLCRSCRENLFGQKAWKKLWAGGKGASFNTSGSDLMSGAAQDCVLCKCFLQKLPQATAKVSVKIDSRLTLRKGVRPEKVDTIEFTVWPSPSSAGYFLYAAVFAQSGTLAAPYFRTPPDRDGSIQNFDPTFVKSWIHECKTSHSECSKQVLGHTPTRLLDVMQNGSSSVKLHILQENEDLQYVALSYCWGCCHPFTTKKSSLKRHIDGINVSDMPQSFQDAVCVARQLGVRFLWIDALCIIQNCEDDMVNELSHMRYYYQNALLVVAASRAKDVMQGFLDYRPADNIGNRIALTGNEHEGPAAKVPFFDLDGFGGSIFLQLNRPLQDHYSEPIDRRAWTFQERLLCPRVLSFPSTGGYFFQCEREGRHDGSVHSPGGPGSERMHPNYTWTGDISECCMDDPHEAWMMHVRQYSGRRFSISADRYNAIAGVAEAYHDKFLADLGDYIAGHWENHLMKSLHWYCEANDEIWKSDRLEKARPPSWSWMSLDSAVLPLSPAILQKNYVELAKILHVGVELVTEKLPFGPVVTACLSMKARIGKAFWQPKRGRPYSPSLGYESGGLIERAWATADNIETLPKHKKTVYVLPLCFAGPASLLHGLLLQRVVPNYGGLYERVGHFFNAEEKLLDACVPEITLSII